MESSQTHTTAPPTTDRRTRPTSTRTSGVWTGVIAGLIVAILLLIFILENTKSVQVNFLGANGQIALGVALLCAAVAGALIVALIGAARMAQLRMRARRAERSAVPQ